MKLKKIIIVLTLFVLCFVGHLNASVKGDYIVTANNDTTQAVIKSVKGENMVCVINGVKTKYTVQDILYYREGDVTYESALVAANKNGQKKWYFLKKETTKKLILLVLFGHGGTGGGMSVQYFCRRPNESRENIKGIYDMNDLCEICSDCPSLVEQLRSKNPEWQGGTSNAVSYYINNQNCN